MADKVVKKGTNIFDELLKSEPKLSVLSDNPVSLADMREDVFDLGYHLGPVYDLIRTPDTQMPLTIGINGKWGTGKSTAMKWLREMLDEWNKLPQSKGKIRTRNIWFCPWKYHDKEELWKGLIAEVILNTTDFSKATPKTVVKAVKLLFSFIGKSALNILSASEYEFAGFKIKGEAAKEIKESFDQTNHPEKPFLNKYEDGLKEWVRDTLGSKNERMVIFIDDLDRCMPDIALQMLESLKLYLNIDKLIFVIGMDRDVVKESVAAYYKEKKIEGVEPDEYLDKMLQLELNLSPQKKQMDIYFDDLLDSVNYKQNIDEKHEQLREHLYQLFRDLISKHGGRNPRKIKRLINSSLIRGCGAEKITNIENNNKPTFEQGVQIFFIQMILAKEYNQTDLVGDGGRGDKFFEMWSEVNSKYLTSKKVSRFLPELIELQAEFEKKPLRIIPEESIFDGPGVLDEDGLVKISDKIPKQYHKLIRHLHKNDLPITLIANDDLDVLMQIEYSMTIAEKAKDQQIKEERPDDTSKIKEEIARQLGKHPDNFTDDDYKSVKALVLRREGIRDISLIDKLRNINSVNLGDNQIADIYPLSNLTSIKTLSLHENKIDDISPLKRLLNVEELYLYDNQIRDISPLSNLNNITKLTLSDNLISNIIPLCKLENLKSLDLNGNYIIDISPLMYLKNITLLYLNRNKISDISVLSDLTNIELLDLNANKINDVSALNNLTNITELYLYSNQINDVSALANLKNIDRLVISDNQIKDIDALANISKISNLNLRSNDIIDISPLSNLTNLTELYLGHNQISDISPLFKLKQLKILNIEGNNYISYIKVEELKEALPKLKIER